mmetsp:Transcript_3851/g.8809  ORF Transcript_3851/g.8809 Transcript_3851/m.8809 type:complete len:358 (+) Transcript_3851:1824-2897(+)
MRSNSLQRKVRWCNQEYDLLCGTCHSKSCHIFHEGTITVHATWIESQLGKMGGEQDITLQNGSKVLAARYGYLELSVKDSGAGMTEAQLGKLFKSAGIQFNANALQGGGGTGLGLYISKGIMEQHGGTLSVDSKGLGTGTTFTLTLPMYLDANEAAHIFARDDTERTFAVYEDEEDSGPLHILAVDDSISNLKLLKRLLEKRGHVVFGAENGQEAVEKVRQADEHFDIICIDNHMPVMDGPTAVKAMRDLGCDSFIVGITGNVLPEDIELFKSKGANAVLPKPFRIAELEQLQVEHSIVARTSQEQALVDIEMGTALPKPFRIAELEQLQVEHSIVARTSQEQALVDIDMGPGTMGY